MLSSINRLFQSDKTLDRIEAAQEIINTLNTDDDFGSTEKLVRHHFINTIKAFAVSQNPKQKEMIAGYSRFYKKHYPRLATRRYLA